jgi:hypothetical protein
MLSGKMVNFEGTSWPSAKIIGRQPIMTKFVGPAGMAVPKTSYCFDLALGDKPRPWSTTVTQGFWRTFVEVDDDGGEKLAAFVRRYGLPYDPRDAAATGTINNSVWFGLRVGLIQFARAWDQGEISRIQEPGRAEAESWLQFSELRAFAGEFTLVPDPSGAPDLVLRANNLGAFMWASAVSALLRKVAMRRCRTCDVWFELHRRDRLYCSDACRTAHHRGDQLVAPATEG